VLLQPCPRGHLGFSPAAGGFTPPERATWWLRWFDTTGIRNAKCPLGHGYQNLRLFRLFQPPWCAFAPPNSFLNEFAIVSTNTKERRSVLNCAPIMSIVTRQGDGGQTRLIYGERVSKADLQVEAYGTQDELNAFLGLARAACSDERTKAELEGLQRDTFVVGAELAAPAGKRAELKTRVSSDMTKRLDDLVADIEKLPGLLDDWALPGATQDGAAIDCARVVARRAERCAIRLIEFERQENEVPENKNAELLRYLNRVSDVLWLLGRRLEIERGVDGALHAEEHPAST